MSYPSQSQMWLNIQAEEGREKSHAKSKSKGKLTCFYCGKPGHFQKDFQHLKMDKGICNDVKLRKIPNEKGTLAVAMSEELFFICEHAKL